LKYHPNAKPEIAIGGLSLFTNSVKIEKTIHLTDYLIRYLNKKGIIKNVKSCFLVFN